jgi:hypothetical protein
MKTNRNLLLILGVVVMATLFQGCAAQNRAVEVYKNKGDRVHRYSSYLDISEGRMSDNKRNLTLFVVLSKELNGLAQLEVFNSTLKRQGGWDGRPLGNPTSFTVNGLTPLSCNMTSRDRGVFYGEKKWLVCKFKQASVIKMIKNSHRYDIRLKANNYDDLIQPTRYTVTDPKEIQHFKKVLKCYKQQAQTCEEPKQK